MTRYSEAISDELKDKVLRIKAQKITDFKSCAFETMKDMGEDLSVSRWIRAQKDEDSNDWIVKEYRTSPYNIQDNETRATDLNKVPAKHRIIMHRACLMDALHACAAFETYERAKGKLPIGPEKEDMGLKHYQIAAEEEEGIPFDMGTGLPVPAANGIVLGEDVELPALSEEFEERSKGNLIAKENVPALNAHDIMGRDLDVPHNYSDSSSKSARTIITSAQQLETQHKKVMKNMEKLTDTFMWANDNEFKRKLLPQHPWRTTLVSSALLSLPMTLPTAIATTSFPAILAVSVSAIIIAGLYTEMVEDGPKEGKDTPTVSEFWRDNTFKSPMHTFARQLNRVREDIKKLDHEEEKAQLLQKTDKIELSAYALRARYAFNEAANNDSWRSRRRMKRDLDRLEQKAHALGMSQNDLAPFCSHYKKTRHHGTLSKKISMASSRIFWKQV